MAKIALKKLLTELTLEEQKLLLMTFFAWSRQEHAVGIRQGLYKMPVGGIRTVYEIDPTFGERLGEAVAGHDKEGALKTTLADVFRNLARMQKDATGPQLNTWCRHHLPEPLFRAFYGAAGLDIDQLLYDETFPTEPLISA